MKKVIIPIILLIFTASLGFSQTQLTFKFTNAEITNDSPPAFAFDIEVKADNPGNYHRDLQLYINYNPDAFGSDVIANSVIELTPLGLLADHYGFVNMTDNTHSKFAIITEALHEMAQTGSPDHFNEVPTEFTALVHIELIISGDNQMAGINFDGLLMNGGQYFQDVSSIAPLAYKNPCLYENDLNDFLLSGQTLDIPEGWSGISSYMEPADNNLENLLSPIVDDLIILQTFDGFYYPLNGINTLNTWQSTSGYIIKMENERQFRMTGSLMDGSTISLLQGWNIIPVLSSCDISTEELFSEVIADVRIVKQIAGTGVFWPEMGINTLPDIWPGKAYFVMMENEGELTFPECTPIPTFPLKGEGADPGSNHQHDQRGTQYKNSKVQRNVAAMRAGTPSPQGEVKKTATTHTIALPKEALTNLSLPIGSLIKTYDLSGNCFGAGLWQIENTSITLFGDDPLTNVKDGFYENDQILLELISNDDAISLQVEYDLQQPNADGLFHTNGLSAIKTIELGSTGLDNLSQSSFDVFPNPADEVLNITKNFEGKAGLSIINIQGKIVFVSEFDGMSFELDIKNLQAGIYFIELKSEQANVVKKVVVE